MFQLTLPEWGATGGDGFAMGAGTSFNSRSPSGERRRASEASEPTKEFQLTLPERGATRCFLDGSKFDSGFQLTLPERGATHQAIIFVDKGKFQLTLPERGATDACPCASRQRSFNSRSPSGERPPPSPACHFAPKFQLTLPERGATASRMPLSSTFSSFNSRSPSGERLEAFSH